MIECLVDENLCRECNPREEIAELNMAFITQAAEEKEIFKAYKKAIKNIQNDYNKLKCKEIRNFAKQRKYN